MWVESEGIIIYDPYRGQMKKKTNWWCVLEVDQEITRYFRWWVEQRYHEELCQPAWDAHVSAVRGERPAAKDIDLWKKYDKMKVKFLYDNNVHQLHDKPHFWTIDIKCDFLLNIRKEFGFPYDYGLHMTIGRSYHGEHTRIYNQR